MCTNWPGMGGGPTQRQGGKDARLQIEAWRQEVSAAPTSEAERDEAESEADGSPDGFRAASGSQATEMHGSQETGLEGPGLSTKHTRHGGHSVCSR